MGPPSSAYQAGHLLVHPPEAGVSPMLHPQRAVELEVVRLPLRRVAQHRPRPSLCFGFNARNPRTLENVADTTFGL